jgi:UDP-glucose 4-epimerase
MPKSIVTGGSGFIGSHLVDKLVNMGHDVIVIDDESAEAHDNFYYNSKAEYVIQSIVDYDLIKEFFTNADYVFHLAAESRIQPTIERPQMACQVNFIGTCNVLEATRKYANKNARVMYSSTSSGYGLANKWPLKESMKRDCLNPYSVAKVAGEDLCKMYYTLYGVETVAFRYFNVYGERQPLKGQYAPVVGLFMRQQKANEPMTIIGDGEQTRDYTHVSDVVNANILAMTCENGLGEVHNVGTGKQTSVNELATLVGRADSGKYQTKTLPARPAEARETQADITKTTKNLGWIPKISLNDWVNAQFQHKVETLQQN